ncbi:MAG: YdcF family protein [Bacteroidales bacterium]|nr:YdcF family protein [Bacteroidales bacterium]
MKKFLLMLAALAGLAVLLVVFCDLRIRSYSAPRLYADPQELPHRHAALLLGTSSNFRDGRPNLYFTNRIEAARTLLELGKVDKILVSGDNRHISYNEPQMMRKALLSRGVPDSLIVLDYAGFRTLDSVIRAKEVFGQDTYIVVSQRFHNERAVFIAGRHGIDAIGFDAEDVHSLGGLRTRLRELLARVKVFVDLATHQGPHFLGEKVEM